MYGTTRISILVAKWHRVARHDVDKQIALLQERIVIDPAETKSSYQYFAEHGYSPISIEHPSWVRDYVSTMGIEAR